MKFEIDQIAIDEALKAVQFAMVTKPTIPVLNNVLIQVVGQKVKFTLRDQEITISCEAKAKVFQEGETTLPVRKLINIVRRLPALPISMELINENLTQINCQQICFKIQGISASEYPETLVEKFTSNIVMQKELLRKIIINTSFASINDITKPALMGVYLKFAPYQVVCVATDGRRLAFEMENTHTDYSGNCLIPQKTVHALMKLMEVDGRVNIQFDDKSVQFSFLNEAQQETVIYSKLIEGKFPNYEQIIPKNLEYSATIDRQNFAECLKRMALILTESAQGVKLHFVENKLIMSATTENDLSREEMEITYSGPELTFPFNPHYLIDPLRRLESDNIVFHFTGSKSVAAMKCGTSFTYVIMPMRM